MRKYEVETKNGELVEVEEYTLGEFLRPYLVKISYPVLYVAGFLFTCVFTLAACVVALDLFLIAGGAYAGEGAREVFFTSLDFILNSLKVIGLFVAIFGGTFAVGFAVGGVAVALRKIKNRRCRKVAKIFVGVAMTLMWPTMTVVEYLEDAYKAYGTLNLIDLVVGGEDL